MKDVARTFDAAGCDPAISAIAIRPLVEDAAKAAASSPREEAENERMRLGRAPASVAAIVRLKADRRARLDDQLASPGEAGLEDVEAPS